MNPPKPRFATVTLLTATLIMGAACKNTLAPSDPPDLSVFSVGSAAYARKIASLRVSPEEARTLVAEHIRLHNGGIASLPAFTGEHAIIIGDAYHFFVPRKQGGIPRTGYYVDGMTGAVTFREIPGEISTKDDPPVPPPNHIDKPAP